METVSLMLDAVSLPNVIVNTTCELTFTKIMHVIAHARDARERFLGLRSSVRIQFVHYAFAISQFCLIYYTFIRATKVPMNQLPAFSRSTVLSSMLWCRRLIVSIKCKANANTRAHTNYMLQQRHCAHPSRMSSATIKQYHVRVNLACFT